MDVILLTKVANLGNIGDRVTVKSGYGRNFLLPTGQAILATPSAKKMLAEDLKQRAHKEAKVVADATSMAENLKRLELKLTSSSGKGGKLFGAVTNHHMAEELSKLGYTIDKKFITIIGGTVKTAGKYSSKIRLHRAVTIDFGFEVIGQES